MTDSASGGGVASAVRRFLGRLDSRPLIVALSGGLDSCVLLHVLRFRLASAPKLLAAHFDHRMRPGSEADAAWVRGLCRAWDVALEEGEAEGDGASAGLSSEDAARTARYAFLDSVRARHPGAVLLTAHHADDQAETVLFRALRGTGIEGLAGIPALRCDPATGEPVVGRPLLDVWREELEGYADRHGLGWREDPTNESRDYARNVLRHEILPTAEAKVAPGARRSLVRLARIARSESAAWDAALEVVLRSLDLRAVAAPASPSASLDRSALLDLAPEIAGRVLRHVAARLGVRLDAATTKRALDFVHGSQSGRHIQLGGGAEVRLKGDRVIMRP